MQCPYCGDDMERGVIQGRNQMVWQKKPSRLTYSLHMEDSVILTQETWFRIPRVMAYLCRGCEKIIIDYEDEKCDTNRAKWKATE